MPLGVAAAPFGSIGDRVSGPRKAREAEVLHTEIFRIVNSAKECRDQSESEERRTLNTEIL
jgi:hypothetical protein